MGECESDPIRVPRGGQDVGGVPAMYAFQHPCDGIPHRAVYAFEPDWKNFGDLSDLGAALDELLGEEKG